MPYIRQLKAALQNQFNQQDEDIEADRRVRTLEDPVIMPPELKRVDVEVRDPTAADEVARVVATLTLNPPRCRVTPADLSDKAQRNSTKREEWTMQVFQEAGRRVAGEDTMRDIVDACCGDGGAWWKLLFDPDRWEERFNLNDSSAWVDLWLKTHPDDDADTDDKEVRKTVRRAEGYLKFNDATEKAKQRSGCPFTWLSVDVRTVYPVWQGGELVEVLECTERPTVTAMRQYGLSVERDREGRANFRSSIGRPLSPDEASMLGPTVQFIEYWNKTHCAYYLYSGAVGFHELECFEHGYGKVPYFFASGMKPNYKKGYKVGWGISRTKRWLVQMRSFLLTLLAQAAAQDVGQPIAEETVDAAAAVLGGTNRPTTNEQWPLNGMMHLPPGRTLKPVFNHPVSQSFNELMGEVTKMIANLDTPRVSSQIGGGLEGAGFAIAQVLMEAKTRHNPYVANIERALAETTEFLWHLVRTKVKETVWVKSATPEGKRGAHNYLGIGPDDLEDEVGVSWHLDPEQPSAKIIESRYWTERIQAGTASVDMAIEAMGDNPDEVRLGIMMDQARQQPWYTQWLWQEAMQEIGRGDILQEQALEAAKTGAVPGMPPEMMAAMGMGQQGMGGEQGMGGAPDMGALAMSRFGAGAQGMPMPPMGGGVGPGAVLPQQGGQAMVQSLVQ